MSNYSSVCSATNKIIDLFDLHQKVKVYSYKDEECFKKLWNFHHIEHDSGPPTILVVWDGILSGEAGGINTSKYLTPIDWAVGYSLSIANREKDTTLYPDLRIIILDVDSQSVSDSDSLQFVRQSSNMDIISMPWIRSFSANATCSGRDVEAFFRTLVSLGSDSAESTDLGSDRSETEHKSFENVDEKEEEITSTSSPEVCTPSIAEIPILRQNIDVVFKNLKKLVDYFRGRSESVEEASEKDNIIHRYQSLKESIVSGKRREIMLALGNFFKALAKPEESESSSGTIEGGDTSTLSPPGIETVCKETSDSKPVTEISDEPLISMKEAFKKKTRKKSKKEMLDLEIIRNIWAAFLTRPSTPGDSHAIANLVGPLLLMKEAGNSHVNALQSLMGSIGLLPESNNKDASKEDDENAKAILSENNAWTSWNPHAVGPEPLKLILIDDIFKSGWGRMLCWAMGVNYQLDSENHENELVKISECKTGKDEKIVVKAASSAECILTKLEGLGDQEDKRFEFSLDGSAGMEILFLDLRLYSRDFKAEAKFFEKLIEIARKFTEGQNENLPWDGFTNDEIKKVNDWIKSDSKKQEGSGYMEALTLLPRILALTDLSLPIVLFSSTGRRDITEKLKPYGNIITVFEKPRFTIDIPVDIAKQTRDKFQEVMKEAHQILRVRQKIQRISTYKKEEQPEFNVKGIHVELFIDETYETSVELNRLPFEVTELNLFKGIKYKQGKLVYREGSMNNDEKQKLLSLDNSKEYQSAVNYLYNNSQIYVGGVFAIFSGENNEAARRKADDFDNDLVNKGVRYFDSLGYGVTPKGIKDKKSSSATELNDVMTAHTNNKPDALGFIRLGNLLRRKNDQKFDFFNSQSADNHFRLTLETLIEVFLCETLPAHFEESALEYISVSVFAGTRIKPYSDKDAEQMKELNESKYHLGMESIYDDENILYSITRGSIYPIVSDILCFHGVSRRINRVSGITFVYESNEKWCRFPVYFFCRNCKEMAQIRNDDVKHKIEVSLNIAKVKNISHEKGFGFIEPLDDSIKSNLFVHKTKMKDFDSVRSGDFVKYENYEKSDRSLVANNVEPLSENEKKEYENAKKKYYISEKGSLKCSCGEGNSDFHPDYRSLHYIADEILGHVRDVKERKGYGESIKQIPGGFDDILNDDLKNSIKASRYLDLGETVSAIAEVKVTNDHRPGNYSVKPLLLQRIASKLDKLKGKEFIKLVQMEKEIKKKM